nr:immunoglobulin heavy chain junction region [Macaca mulatta]MOW24553.1 immunoglobulin heavy chain junction region [Macaca mulatta]MOW24658.1 immunoglobulin heavy chain junction region [Macaca mulatta]MOW26156.1 immunoglobulin heavy chain junction region [Macaca mulatta]MOW26350.1 immunoglobulin heavy chain junction region [Macaca mulatta]
CARVEGNYPPYHGLDSW